MKPSKLNIIALKGLFSLHKIWLVGSLYFLITVTCLLVIARKGSWSDRGIFDLFADVGGALGSTNHNMFIAVAIPIIVTFMTQFIEKNAKTLYVISYRSRFHTYHANVLSAIWMSLIFTSSIMLYSFLFGWLMVGLENTWLTSSGTISELLKDEDRFQSIISNFATYKIVLILFITKFLGCLMIAFSALFLKQFVKSSALIVIILIALASVDQLGILPFPIFTWAATLTMWDWLKPMTTLYHSIYLLTVSLVLYAVTGWFYERKDFLS